MKHTEHRCEFCPARFRFAQGRRLHTRRMHADQFRTPWFSLAEYQKAHYQPKPPRPDRELENRQSMRGDCRLLAWMDITAKFGGGEFCKARAMSRRALRRIKHAMANNKFREYMRLRNEQAEGAAAGE